MKFSKLGILTVRNHQLFPAPFRWLSCGDWPLSFEMLYSYTQLNHLLNEWSANPPLLGFCRLLSPLATHPFLLVCLCRGWKALIAGVLSHRGEDTHTTQSHTNCRTDSYPQLEISLRHQRVADETKPFSLFGQSSPPAPLFWGSVQLPELLGDLHHLGWSCTFRSGGSGSFWVPLAAIVSPRIPAWRFQCSQSHRAAGCTWTGVYQVAWGCMTMKYCTKC